MEGENLGSTARNIAFGKGNTRFQAKNKTADFSAQRDTFVKGLAPSFAGRFLLGRTPKVRPNPAAAFSAWGAVWKWALEDFARNKNDK